MESAGLPLSGETGEKLPMMNRRECLLLGLAPLARAAAPAIRSIEVWPVPYEVTAYFRFFTKPERPSVVVKLTLEDGTAGWGQSVPMQTWSYETVESTVTALKNYLAPALIGHHPLDIHGAHQKMNKAIAASFSTGMPIAKAGIDLALHDIAGKLATKTLPEVWGRKPLEKVTLSYTVNVRHLNEAEELVAEGRRLGYKHFNLKVAPNPTFDLDLARMVRKLAPDCFLWADANGGYDPATALRIAPKLADIGVDVLEQPVASNRLSAFRDLKTARRAADTNG